MNRCIFSGRLTDNPELKRTQNICVCAFSIAINEGYGENKKTQYPKIIVWGKQAEYVCNYGKKGMFIEVETKYNQKTYDNQQREKVHTHEFVADSVKLIFDKSSNNQPMQQSNDDDFNIPSYGDYTPNF